MLLATLLAAAQAAAPAPKAPAAAPSAQAASLDLVPAFVGACMNPGPDADKIRAVVVKAGGVPAQQEAGATAKVQAYIFQNSGLPYSVVFDRGGTCSIVSGRVDIDETMSSLDRLVIGSAKVFDISRTDAKAHVEGETVLLEYLLSSKNKNGGLRLTLSRVVRNGQRPSIFLTRRVVPK